MNDKELYEHKITATRIICWSGVSALVGAVLPIISILAVYDYRMIWGGVIVTGIVLIQFFALAMVWFHKKNQQAVNIPLPPFVKKKQDEMQAQIDDLKEQVGNLQTIDRVDRQIKARKAGAEPSGIRSDE